MKRLAWVLLSITVISCSGMESRILDTNARQVTIEVGDDPDTGKLLDMAEKECDKFDRVAVPIGQMPQQRGQTWSFECKDK